MIKNKEKKAFCMFLVYLKVLKKYFLFSPLLDEFIFTRDKANKTKQNKKRNWQQNKNENGNFMLFCPTVTRLIVLNCSLPLTVICFATKQTSFAHRMWWMFFYTTKMMLLSKMMMTNLIPSRYRVYTLHTHTRLYKSC